MIIDVECPRCNGTGETEQGPDAYDRCPRCLGKGVVDYDLDDLEYCDE